MKKETQTICQALLDEKPKSAARTSTDGESLFLHGNKIATLERYPYGGIKKVTMTLAGWGTVTTRERLNGLIQSIAWRANGAYTRAGFSQKKGKQYYTDPNGNVREINPHDTVTLFVY